MLKLSWALWLVATMAFIAECIFNQLPGTGYVVALFVWFVINLIWSGCFSGISDIDIDLDFD